MIEKEANKGIHKTQEWIATIGFAITFFISVAGLILLLISFATAPALPSIKEIIIILSAMIILNAIWYSILRYVRNRNNKLYPQTNI